VNAGTLRTEGWALSANVMARRHESDVTNKFTVIVVNDDDVMNREESGLMRSPFWELSLLSF
jgi:hypothetical protein